MKQRYFKLPPHQFFERLSDDTYRYERRGIISRTKLVYKLFGPPRSMLFAGTMTAATYYEMMRSYISGNFLAAIFSAHALVESMLGFAFITTSGDESIAEGGFARMINVAYDRGWISSYLHHQLEELRRMRIAYFHTHVGLNVRGAMKRYLDKKGYGYQQHQRDAKEALRVVHEFLRENSPGFFSLTKSASRRARKMKPK